MIVRNTVTTLIRTSLSLRTVRTSGSHLLNTMLDRSQMLYSLFRRAALLPLQFNARLTSLSRLGTRLTARRTHCRDGLRTLTQRTRCRLGLQPLTIAPPPLTRKLGKQSCFLTGGRQVRSLTATRRRRRSRYRALLVRVTTTCPRYIVPRTASARSGICLLVPGSRIGSLAQRLRS